MTRRLIKDVSSFRAHLTARIEARRRRKCRVGKNDDDDRLPLDVIGNELNDAEFGIACGEWFLADTRNVALFEKEINAQDLSAAQIFRADVAWYVFSTIFSDASNKVILHLLSLFGLDVLSSITRLRFSVNDSKIPLQTWVVFKSIQHLRLTLAQELIFGCARYSIPPLADVITATTRRVTEKGDVSWVGMFWSEHRQFAKLMHRRRHPSTPQDNVLDRSFWNSFLGAGAYAGVDGVHVRMPFALHLAFVVDVLRRALPVGTTITAADLFPYSFHEKMSSTECMAHVHLRKCFDAMYPDAPAHHQASPPRAFSVEEFAAAVHESALKEPLFRNFP